MEEQALMSLLQGLGLKNLVRRGGNIMFSCPSGQHADRRPSCGMKIDDPHPWGCFGCNFKGKTLYSFLLQAGNMTARDARILTGQDQALVDSRKLTLDLTKAELPHFEEDELFAYYPTIRSDTYFKLRGLSLPTIRELGLMHDRRENRVLYPWVLDGKLLALTGRTLDADVARIGGKIKSYLEGMSKRDIIYVPARKIERAPLILVEGEFDAAKVYESGFHNVAALGHAKFSEGQKNLTLNSPATEIWIFTDDDKGGKSAAEMIEAELKGKRITRRMSYDKVRENYGHLFELGMKLDPGVLDPSDIRTILMEDSRQLFPSWTNSFSCR